MIRSKIYLFLVIVLFVAVGLTSSQLISAWNEPSSVAPHSNASAPIYTALSSAAITQEKDGRLNVGYDHTSANSLTVVNGMIRTLDGTRIEQRHGSDPADNAVRDGRIWLRTDANPYGIGTNSAGNYSDIGLAIDIGGGIFHAVADSINPSYFKIAKGGTAYNISLVDLGTPRESKVRVRTVNGTKALRNGYCGNNNIEGPSSLEECDDGNTTSNDGCSSVCKCDAPWTITAPTACTANCGQSAHTNTGSVVCNTALPGCCVTPTPSTPFVNCPATAICYGNWSTASAPACNSNCGVSAYTSLGSVSCSNVPCDPTTRPATPSIACPTTAACCSPSWTPNPNTVCSGDAFTQNNGCGNTRGAIGTKACVTCTLYSGTGCLSCPWGALYYDGHSAGVCFLNPTQTQAHPLDCMSSLADRFWNFERCSDGSVNLNP